MTRQAFAGRTPAVSRVYQHHSLDSTRWQSFVPRDGDVVVASSYKAGTTWVQLIVLTLLGHERPHIDRVSPWLEHPSMPLRWVIDLLDAQTGTRVIKTHLPLDGLIYHENIRYVVVCRDARDVFMSLWNHYQHLVSGAFSGRLTTSSINALPECPSDIRVFWRDWITRGWFQWETEGYPFWGNLRHTATWWMSRFLSNIHFVHFNDLLEHPHLAIERIASHIGIDVSKSRIAQIVDDTTFSNVKRNAVHLLPGAQALFRGGADTFIYRGTNGRWRSALTDEDTALYRDAAKRELPAECADWLERGGTPL